MHWSVHAMGATVVSSSASEMLVGAGTRTRADLALRRVLSSFSLNYEREPEDESKSIAGQVQTSVCIQYLASFLHKSHLFLAHFLVGETLFSSGLQGLQSCWRSSSDRLSIIQLRQDKITHREGETKES